MNKEMTIENCMKEMTSKDATINAVRELITFHLNAQREAIHDTADIIEAPFTACMECGRGDVAIDGVSIDNAYPLTNIK